MSSIFIGCWSGLLIIGKGMMLVAGECPVFFKLILSLRPGLLFSRTIGPAISTSVETHGRLVISRDCRAKSTLSLLTFKVSCMLYHCRLATMTYIVVTKAMKP